VPILPALGDPPSEASVEAAAQALAAGQIVAIPTDTVYGLAADPFRTGAADRLFALKRRPRDVALPVLVSGLEQTLELTEDLPDVARRLIEAFWPGPLTVVLPRRAALAADLGTDEATIGVRCPNHPVPLALSRLVGPLATTSANIHGQPTPPTAASVLDLFGDAVAIVLDAGPCEGSPSTVVDCTGEEAKLLREGRLPWADVRGVAGA
jgi:L-threonylcarbamoyladenylate synthase